MSSMCRTIRRDMAKRDGTFVSQKPLRDRHNVSFKEHLLDKVRFLRLKKNIENKKEVK